MTTTAPTFTFQGITDERHECDCCGKAGLKRTVALRPVEGGEVVFYGTTCAALALLGRKLTRTGAENAIASMNGERNNWREYADRLSKHFATAGLPSREAAIADYIQRNRVMPAAMWSNGVRWFGWNAGNDAFNGRLVELGWHPG